MLRRPERLAVHLTHAILMGCLLFGAGCDHPLKPHHAAASCWGVEGTWLLAAPSGTLGDRIVVMQISQDSASSVEEVPSRSSTGQRGRAFVPSAIRAMIGCGLIELQALRDSDRAPVAISMQTVADSAWGTIETQGSPDSLPALMIGLRIDPELLLPDSGAVGGSIGNLATPVVLLRIDDARASDGGFLPRLLARGLTGELAIPTGLVGRPRFLTWGEVEAWASLGFGIAAHSRIHSAATGPDFPFMAEVVGSLEDLRARGLPTSVFVQPGSWTDSLFFSPGKLQNWRGALFRNLTTVLEAYVGGSTAPTGLLGRVTFGVSHVTASGVTTSAVRTAYGSALRQGTFTIFLIHTADMTSPDQLDFLLDSVAAAVHAGRLRQVSSSLQLLDP